MSGWSVAHGASSSTGVFLDWSIRSTMVASDSGHLLTLTTPVRLTRDGALEKGDLHDQTRQIILEGVAGAIVPEDGLAAVSELGLCRWIYDAATSFREGPPEPWTGSFRIRARMSDEEVSTRLRLVQERCTEVTETSWSFALGIEGCHGGVGRVRRGGAEPGILICDVDFTPSGDAIPDRVALHKARSFAAEVLGALKLWEGDAEMIGESAGESA
jgi:hypothetical protein